MPDEAFVGAIARRRKDHSLRRYGDPGCRRAHFYADEAQGLIEIHTGGGPPALYKIEGLGRGIRIRRVG